VGEVEQWLEDEEESSGLFEIMNPQGPIEVGVGLDEEFESIDSDFVDEKYYAGRWGCKLM
jgi:hypothetical protein